MSNLDRVVAIGKELQKSQVVMQDFKDKKISRDNMEEKLRLILFRLRRYVF